MLNTLEAAVQRLADLVLKFGVALIAFDALLIMADVIGRNFFGKPILGTVEITRNTVPLIVFCQVPATILAGRMLRVSALYSRLSVRQRWWVELLSACLGGGLFLVFIVNMWSPMMHAWRIWEIEGMAGIRVPLAPIRTALVILWAITLLAIAVTMLQLFRRRDEVLHQFDRQSH